MKQALIRPVQSAIEAQPQLTFFHSVLHFGGQDTNEHLIEYILQHNGRSSADDPHVAGKVPKTLKRKYDTPMQALGAVLTELRLEKRWSYHKVSSELDCDPSYMNGIEHGTHNPTFEMLQAIADLHKIKLSRLIARAERKYEGSRRGRAVVSSAP